MKIAVTIVVPAYNASEYIAKTVKSVLQQTYTDFELLVIDDGSTDDTADIVHNFSLQDSRVKLISQENQGVSVARNTGIKMAKGEFIAFLDADDLWLPNKLVSHLEHLHQNSEVGVSFGKVEFLSSNGELTGYISNSPLGAIKSEYLLYENPTVTTSNIVVRREVFEQVGYFDEQISYSEDLEWLLRLSCHQAWKIEGINKVLTRYRISQNSLSSDLYKMEQGWNLLINKVMNYAPYLVNQHYYKAQSRYLRYLARRTLRLNLSSDVGIRYMNRALQSEWTLIFKEPRRTILTTIAVYGKYLMPSLPNKSAKSSIN